MLGECTDSFRYLKKLMLVARMVATTDGDLSATINQFGTVLLRQDSFSQYWVDKTIQVSARGGRGLELATGVGWATTIQAIHGGAKVVANDLDPEHLEILKVVAEEAVGKSAAAERLRLVRDAFPNSTRNELQSASFDTVFAGRLFHFFDGDTFMAGVLDIKRILKIGGFAVITVDFDLGVLPQTFVEEYSRKLDAGDPWPGWIPDIAKYVRGRRGNMVVESRNLMDPNLLLDKFLSVGGFKTVRFGYINRRNQYPISFLRLGRESSGIIVQRVEE